MDAEQNKYPLMLNFLTKIDFADKYLSDELFFNESFFDESRKINLSLSGVPLYCARSSTPPTSCYTAGHTIPAGYTSTGKYKQSKWVNGKTDKRAGK